MSNFKSYEVTLGAGGTGVISIEWISYQAYSDEEYKTDPKIYFIQKNRSIYSYYMECHGTGVNISGLPAYDNRVAISVQRIKSSGYVIAYNDPSLLSNASSFSGEAGQSSVSYAAITFTPFSSQGQLPSTLGFKDSRVNTLNEWTLATNIPVFETDADAAQYIQYGDNIASAVNNRVPEVEGRYFEIINIWTEGTWDSNGFTPATGATEHFRCVRGRIDDERGLAMWVEPGIVNGGLIYSVRETGSTHDLQYSEDGVTWHDTNSFPYSYFYRPRVDEVGTFKFALTFYTNRIPIFADESTADDYISGTAELSEAINFTDISNNYPGSDAALENETGNPDDGTDWGAVYTQSFFHNIYLCDAAAVQDISNGLYDVTPGGVWEDIKKGLDMFGDNPIEALISFMYFPLDLDDVFTNSSSQTYVYFGGFKYDLSGSNTANKLIYPDGYFVCGSVEIKPTFNNWRDVKAMRLFVDLPYCGRYELDTQKYLGKTVKVIYYIDLYTGACLACLVDGGTATDNQGVCLDQYNGIIGEKLPITLTDFSGHASAMINTLLGGGGQAITAGQSIGETGAHAAVGATSGAGAALALGGAALGGAALGGITAAKTVYGLQMNNINKFNQTRGGSSGMLNQYANQKPTFIFVYPEADIPDNFNTMYGTPSNAGGSISSFWGYFEADTVKLNMPGATESEKAKARDLLMNGVFIQ